MAALVDAPAMKVMTAIEAQAACGTTLKRLCGKARRDGLAAPFWAVADIAPRLSGQVIADGERDLEAAIVAWAKALRTKAVRGLVDGRPCFKAETAYPTGVDVIVWAYMPATTPNDTKDGS